MEFRIERAKKEEAANIIEVIVHVWNQMEKKQWFVVDEKEWMYKQIMSGKFVAYKAVERKSGKIAGIFMVAFPGKSQENLGRDIGLKEEVLDQVAHMESAAILPEYRGNRLQYRFMQLAEQELIEKGYHYLMCTVHPDNWFSKNNIINQGYIVVKTVEKYGGHIRNLLLKRV